MVDERGEELIFVRKLMSANQFCELCRARKSGRDERRDRLSKIFRRLEASVRMWLHCF